MRLTFEKGELKAVNDEKFDDPIKAIQKVEEIGAAYGIGRDMHVGDTIIGIKGRVGFEAAAPMLIIGAHKFLEKYTLSKWQQYWKDQVANWYGMFPARKPVSGTGNARRSKPCWSLRNAM